MLRVLAISSSGLAFSTTKSALLPRHERRPRAVIRWRDLSQRGRPWVWYRDHLWRKPEVFGMALLVTELHEKASLTCTCHWLCVAITRPEANSIACGHGLAGRLGLCHVKTSNPCCYLSSP